MRRERQLWRKRSKKVKTVTVVYTKQREGRRKSCHFLHLAFDQLFGDGF